MNHTNRVARFFEQDQPTPAAEPVTGNPVTTAEPVYSQAEHERAFFAWQTTQDILFALEKQVGDLLDIHGPNFEQILSQGLAVEQVELCCGCKEFISGVKLENAPHAIANQLRVQAQKMLAAARLLEHAIQTGEW